MSRLKGWCKFIKLESNAIFTFRNKNKTWKIDNKNRRLRKFSLACYKCRSDHKDVLETDENVDYSKPQILYLRSCSCAQEMKKLLLNHLDWIKIKIW